MLQEADLNPGSALWTAMCIGVLMEGIRGMRSTFVSTMTGFVLLLSGSARAQELPLPKRVTAVASEKTQPFTTVTLKVDGEPDLEVSNSGKAVIAAVEPLLPSERGPESPEKSIQLSNFLTTKIRQEVAMNYHELWCSALQEMSRPSEMILPLGGTPDQASALPQLTIDGIGTHFTTGNILTQEAPFTVPSRAVGGLVWLLHEAKEDVLKGGQTDEKKGSIQPSPGGGMPLTIRDDKDHTQTPLTVTDPNMLLSLSAMVGREVTVLVRSKEGQPAEFLGIETKVGDKTMLVTGVKLNEGRYKVDNMHGDSDYVPTWHHLFSAPLTPEELGALPKLPARVEASTGPEVSKMGLIRAVGTATTAKETHP
jgi:hypothetical protein